MRRQCVGCEKFRLYRRFGVDFERGRSIGTMEFVKRLGLDVSLKKQINECQFDEILMNDHRRMRSVKTGELVDTHAHLVGLVMTQDQLEELMTSSGS